VLQLMSRASELFLQQPATEQRRLLNVVIQDASWKDRALRTTLFEPFEIMRYSNRESRRKENENAGSGRDSEIWLPESCEGLRLRESGVPLISRRPEDFAINSAETNAFLGCRVRPRVCGKSRLWP
jgi:hypothetical protein